MCLNTGTPKTLIFSFETNGKLMALGVPILKHFRVLLATSSREANRKSRNLSFSVKMAETNTHLPYLFGSKMFFYLSIRTTKN